MIGVLFGISDYKRLDTKSRIILFYMAITFISESLAKVLEINEIIRAPVYHFYSIISFFIILLFFIKVLNLKNEIRYIYMIFFILPVVGILNCIFFQPLTIFNSNILILKSFTVIVFSLYALYKILIDDKNAQSIYKEPHFWFSVLFMILYSSAFFFWTCLMVLVKNRHYLYIAQNIQGVLNAIVYTGFSLVFIFYPKKTV